MDVSVVRRALVACVSAALLTCGSLAAAAPSWGWGYKVTTIASGLDNPRDLAWGSDGKLYVAEAGHGGSECETGLGPEKETQCIGFTSGISRLDAWGPHRVVSGLLSAAEPSGFAAAGLSGISILGGDAFVVENLASDVLPASAPHISPKTLALAAAEAGRLGEFEAGGSGRVIADVGHFDFLWSKENTALDPQFPDANPYAVLATKWGELVVDAASNTLDFVTPGGSVKVLAFFPNPPVPDAVPTCLSRGPDGAIYVGELTGAGDAPGAAVVWRWTPGHAPTVWASGLTAVTGCGFGSDGQFYALEFSTLGLVKAAPGTGALVRVPPHSSSPTTIVSGLSFPNGFAAGKGALYFSNWSIAPAQSAGGPTGQVVKVTRW